MTEKHRHQMALEQYLHVHLIIIQRYPVCINDFSKFQLWLLMEASDLQLHIIHDTEQVTALIIELVNCTRSQLDCEDQIQLASYEVGQAVHAVMAVANSDIVMNAGQVMADSATSLGHAVDIAKKHIEGVKIRPAIRVLEQFIANERVI
ncbi:hypothetical protein BDF19DRAFT_415820 [Syncephalis fuscata]|nr:hypothetical protein BDF19DRAFT_415820 [Syncephalis fuscata]